MISRPKVINKYLQHRSSNQLDLNRFRYLDYSQPDVFECPQSSMTIGDSNFKTKIRLWIDSASRRVLSGSPRRSQVAFAITGPFHRNRNIQGVYYNLHKHQSHSRCIKGILFYALICGRNAGGCVRGMKTRDWNVVADVHTL